MCLIGSFIGWRFRIHRRQWYRLIFLMKCVADAVFVFMNRPFFLHSVLKRMLVFHSKYFGKICLSSRTSKFNKWVSGMFQVVDFVESNGFFLWQNKKTRKKVVVFSLWNVYFPSKNRFFRRQLIFFCLIESFPATKHFSIDKKSTRIGYCSTG